MQDTRKSTIVFIYILVIFIFNKFMFRPYVLARDFPEFIRIFTLSLPNLLEAIMGSFLITNLILLFKSKGFRLFSSLSEGQIYITAVIAAALFVITQELKIHNLGGRNQYDPFDVLFSVIGLIMAYGLLLKIKPKIN